MSWLGNFLTCFRYNTIQYSTSLEEEELCTETENQVYIGNLYK